ncbi:MAG: 2-dehydropantoate 2-reductase, partial [Candidatus Sumerlaeia bacterium]|nr:2-dehydropantoate 2-reductase [Candidatus Sumerlaeia bacterium]
MTVEPFGGKIAVVGCGALGALYGLYLHQSGGDLHFLTRSDHDVASNHGYTLTKPDGTTINLKPPVHKSPTDIGPVDLVIVGLKTTDNEALANLLPPLCGPATLVLTLQNGLGNEENITSILATLPGGENATSRVLGGVAFLCSNRIAPAHIHHIDQGWIHMAEHGGPATERTHSIAAAFERAGVKCVAFDSLRTIRWQKQAWNIPFNGLSVVAKHADTRQLLDDKETRLLINAIMEEVANIAAAENVTLEPDFLAQLMEVTEGIGKYKTSMLLDFEAGRPMEVEAIVGEPLRR